eukprot:12225940-Alexandrium_andersonii.AAC.1
MSASLVGSEMCIRDSDTAGACTPMPDPFHGLLKRELATHVAGPSASFFGGSENRNRRAPTPARTHHGDPLPAIKNQAR